MAKVKLQRKLREAPESDWVTAHTWDSDKDAKALYWALWTKRGAEIYAGVPGEPEHGYVFRVLEEPSETTPDDETPLRCTMGTKGSKVYRVTAYRGAGHDDLRLVGGATSRDSDFLSDLGVQVQDGDDVEISARVVSRARTVREPPVEE